MLFEEYIQHEDSKLEKTTSTPVINAATTLTLAGVVNESDPNVMVGRIINNKLYCIFKTKTIDLTELDIQIKALYASKGYLGIGFSKLEPADFVKYPTAKTVLKKLFANDLYSAEIDTKNAAKYFFAAESIIS